MKAEIVDTQGPDRIPAVLSGRADIGIAVASDTLERAKTIGFSIPYFVFKTVILAREDSGIDGAEGMRGHTVGGPAGAAQLCEPVFESPVRSGRYAELYAKWVGTEGGPPPELVVPGTYR